MLVHYEQLCDLCRPHNIAGIVKCKRFPWTEPVLVLTHPDGKMHLKREKDVGRNIIVNLGEADILETGGWN
jgi:hypothetical protein